MVVALVPVGFIGWISAQAFRDVPYWDEFSTTLKFFSQLHDSSSWGETIGLFIAADEQHCMVTTRLIFAAIYALTGKINFITLATIGNLAMVVAIVILAFQPRQNAMRFVYGAFLSLLIFQLQHFENQLLSYAAIDHYQVVFWSAASLALLHRGGRPATQMAALAATAGVSPWRRGWRCFRQVAGCSA